MPRRRSNIGRNTSAAKRVRVSRTNENDEERDFRLLLDRERHFSQRELETPEHRQIRLHNDRIRHRHLGTVIQNNSSRTQNINRWSTKEYSAMNYDSTVDYRTDPTIFIGSPSTVCQ